MLICSNIGNLYSAPLYRGFSDRRELDLNSLSPDQVPADVNDNRTQIVQACRMIRGGLIQVASFSRDTHTDDEYHTDPMQCPACRRDVPESSRFCLACGARVDGSQAPTLTAAAGSPPSSDTLDGAQFIPGTMLAGRCHARGPWASARMRAQVCGHALVRAEATRVPPQEATPPARPEPVYGRAWPSVTCLRHVLKPSSGAKASSRRRPADDGDRVIQVAADVEAIARALRDETGQRVQMLLGSGGFSEQHVRDQLEQHLFGRQGPEYARRGAAHRGEDQGPRPHVPRDWCAIDRFSADLPFAPAGGSSVPEMSRSSGNRSTVSAQRSI